jgi:hypothetical protein
LNERSDAMRLAGWATLTNSTGATFEQAEVQLVAGRLNILAADEGGSAAQPVHPNGGETDVDARERLVREAAEAEVALLRECFALDVPLVRPQDAVEFLQSLPRADMRMRMAAAPEQLAVTAMRVEREELGDYQLYRLPWRTDLGARQTKQVLFLDEPAVEVERLYSFRLESLTAPPAEEVAIPDLVVRFENTSAQGLGEPLPSGIVRVFEGYGGRDVFAGEAQIADRPVGLPVELTVGRAQNVMLEVTSTLERGSSRRGRTRVGALTEHRIVNNKSVPIDLEIRHGVESYYSDLELRRTSRPMRRKYGDLAWRFEVPPGEERLRYELSALEP